MTLALTSASILMFALQVLYSHMLTHAHTVMYNKLFNEKTELPASPAGVRFSSECAEEVQRQRLLLWDAAAFLLSNQIPAVVSLWSDDVQAYHVREVQDDIYGCNAAPVCVCVW